MPKLTGTQMKYLHVIYAALQSSDDVRCGDISRQLGVSKASASRMTRVLADFGLITVGKLGKVLLTPSGEAEGASIHEKFTKLHPFFARYLELEEQEAIDNAFSFLFLFSEDCVEKLLEKEWTITI